MFSSLFLHENIEKKKERVGQIFKFVIFFMIWRSILKILDRKDTLSIQTAVSISSFRTLVSLDKRIWLNTKKTDRFSLSGQILLCNLLLSRTFSPSISLLLNWPGVATCFHRLSIVNLLYPLDSLFRIFPKYGHSELSRLKPSLG